MTQAKGETYYSPQGQRASDPPTLHTIPRREIMTKNERQRIASKIKALLAKTTDAGCTEDEAMTAAIIAKSLMDKYQINMSEAELEQEGCEQTSTPKFKWGFDVQFRMAYWIQKFCEVKVWRHGSEIQYFGLKTDAEFAQWLMLALEEYIWNAAEVYAVANFNLDVHGKTIR